MIDAPKGQVVTRFAPSPTGFLHIGGARTALFNWLFARGRQGKFLIRIEDTDRNRSTPEATQAIFDGLKWLGLDYDEAPIFQFERKARHQEIALELLERGQAYKCFSPPEEIQAFREAARAEKRSTLFKSPWRDADLSTHPDLPYVIRLRAPQTGQTVIEDQIQGDVTIGNDQLDDMILLRSDSTPVYMLAVAVDDYDSGVTHIIRGDDHLTNAARQSLIYTAMGWPLPVYAHLPLIHGTDGKKLSKRHGALGVDEYQKMGYTPSAMRNYLARLGWSHGDEEVFDDSQAQSWFELSAIGKSPARFDFDKLNFISAKHIADTDNATLQQQILDFWEITGVTKPSHQKLDLLWAALDLLKQRSKTIPNLLETGNFTLVGDGITPEPAAMKHLTSVSIGILKQLTPQLQNASWSREDLELLMNEIAQKNETKFGKFAGALRAALAGRAATPSVFDMMVILGKEKSILRIQAAIEKFN